MNVLCSSDINFYSFFCSINLLFFLRFILPYKTTRDETSNSIFDYYNIYLMKSLSMVKNIGFIFVYNVRLNATDIENWNTYIRCTKPLFAPCILYPLWLEIMYNCILPWMAFHAVHHITYALHYYISVAAVAFVVLRCPLW